MRPRLHYVHGDLLAGKAIHRYDPSKAIKPTAHVTIHSSVRAQFEDWWARVLDRGSQVTIDGVTGWDHSPPGRRGWCDWVHESCLMSDFGYVPPRQFRYLLRTVCFPSYVDSRRLTLVNLTTGQMELVGDRSLVFFGPLEQCRTRFMNNDHRIR